MTKLRDVARELVGIAEGELFKKEATIVALRREIEGLKKERKDRQLVKMPAQCETCAYRAYAIKYLDKEEKSEKKH